MTLGLGPFWPGSKKLCYCTMFQVEEVTLEPESAEKLRVAAKHGNA